MSFALPGNGPITIPGGSTLAARPAQFASGQESVDAGFVQRALGNMQGSTQFGVGATTNLTAAQAGGFFQPQGGTVNLPATSAVQPGCTFSFTSSGVTTIAANGTDKIAFGSAGNLSSVALGAGDHLTLVYFGNFSGVGLWQAVTGSAALAYSAVFGASLASPGYQKLPSGLIVQWGGGPVAFPSANTLVNTPVTYPIAFPNQTLSVQTTPSNCPQNTFITFSSEVWSATGFTIVGACGTTSAGITARWVAIGR